MFKIYQFGTRNDANANYNFGFDFDEKDKSFCSRPWGIFNKNGYRDSRSYLTDFIASTRGKNESHDFKTEDTRWMGR
jgi:hypothetical protein